MSLLTLKKKLEACLTNNLQAYSQQRLKTRERFLSDCYKYGGKKFVERVYKYGRTEKGIPIDASLWYREYLELIGDLRLAHVLTTGCAQVGKTLGHSLLNIDCLTAGKVNTGWFYDTRTSLDQNVPIMFHPMARFWVQNMENAGFRFLKVYDRTINTRYQIDGVTGIFGYVSGSKYKAADGTAAAGGTIVAYQIDLAFLEERSQYTPGSGDPIKRRLDASILPTRPIRELGTPGGGQGIEAEMAEADRYFYPHYFCPNCNDWFPLDPKGCILRKGKRTDIFGKNSESYFTASGRPSDWFFLDKNNPVTSAYIGCSNCGTILSKEQRLNAQFRDTRTGEFLRNFLDSLPPTIPEKNWTIGVHLSPLTRDRNNLAEEIIKTGLTVLMTADWQQQMLGWQSEVEVSYLSLALLKRAIEAPRVHPDRKPDFRLAGIDVGRSEDWIVIVEFFLPENYNELTIPENIESAVRNVIFGSGIPRTEIPELLNRLYVEYGLIDNEPSRESSMILCRNTCLELADQVSHLKNPVQSTIVSDGGIEYSCWSLRNEKFMNTVLEGFILIAEDGGPLYRLPADWEKWVGNPTDRSPLVHLSGPWRDAGNKWHRGKDNIDDLYMAFLFCEAAFYLTLTKELQPVASVGAYSF